MKTVGSILKDARVRQGDSLADIEAATRIRRKYLEAIENDDYSGMPSLAYAKGFVRNYASHLGLDPVHIMAFFRRQTAESAKSSLLPKGMADPLNVSFIRLTPARFIGLVVAFLVITFFAYFAFQYRRVGIPPFLKVETPKDGILISERKIDVSGKTDPDATVAINGVSILVRPDGQFFDQVELKPGENRISVIATSRFGKTTASQVTVTYLE
jgi:cytoskeletal protein RodZ